MNGHKRLFFVQASTFRPITAHEMCIRVKPFSSKQSNVLFSDIYTQTATQRDTHCETQTHTNQLRDTKA